MFSNMYKTTLLAICVLMVTVAAGCGAGEGNNQASKGPESDKAIDVTLVLDWTPNTNHTGLYVAKDKGYYEEEGLNVTIQMPGEAGADKMVAAGNAQFGVSYQEGVTLARIEGVPIVSIAAVIQHNTSGFAAPTSKGIKSPKDFEGKKYGGWGSPIEQATLDLLMKKDNADASKVNIISMGDADFFTAVKRDIDFAWIFYAWTGIEAELRGEQVDMVYLTDYAKELDYYTPVIVTSEKLIADQPELVEKFMRATSKGYQFAIDQPEEAGELLAAAEPDLDKELVIASQKWLSPRYQDDAARWGEQKLEVWKDYADWMSSNELLEKEFDAHAAFTNDYLPN
jgi:ABC-type nitrate/sulfonate/bicarbonate transport system substrate-binding protein